jgi:NADH-quinone oxidoreductase subunit M
MNAREIGLVLPLLALMLIMGVYPAPFLNRSRASVSAAQQVVSPDTTRSPTVAAAARDQQGR